VPARDTLAQAPPSQSRVARAAKARCGAVALCSRSRSARCKLTVLLRSHRRTRCQQIRHSVKARVDRPARTPRCRGLVRSSSMARRLLPQRCETSPLQSFLKNAQARPRPALGIHGVSDSQTKTGLHGAGRAKALVSQARTVRRSPSFNLRAQETRKPVPSGSFPASSPSLSNATHHKSTLSSLATPSTQSPSMRIPLGAMTTTSVAAFSVPLGVS